METNVEKRKKGSVGLTCSNCGIAVMMSIREFGTINQWDSSAMIKGAGKKRRM